MTHRGPNASFLLSSFHSPKKAARVGRSGLPKRAVSQDVLSNTRHGGVPVEVSVEAPVDVGPPFLSSCLLRAL